MLSDVLSGKITKKKMEKQKQKNTRKSKRKIYMTAREAQVKKNKKGNNVQFHTTIFFKKSHTI